MKYLLATFVVFIFFGCSLKEFNHTESKIIIIKSPMLKFADVGYIRNTDKYVQLELFMAGKSIKKIDINNMICVDEGCMSKSSFNKEYLNENYPDDFLQNLLLGRPIFNSKNYRKTYDGFVQNIIDRHVNITYRKTNKSLFFKDRKNKIIFKIKDIDG